MHIKCLGSFFSLLFHFATFNKHIHFFTSFPSVYFDLSIHCAITTQFSETKMYSIFSSSTIFSQAVTKRCLQNSYFALVVRYFLVKLQVGGSFTSIQHDLVSASANRFSTQYIIVVHLFLQKTSWSILLHFGSCLFRNKISQFWKYLKQIMGCLDSQIK